MNSRRLAGSCSSSVSLLVSRKISDRVPNGIGDTIESSFRRLDAISFRPSWGHPRKPSKALIPWSRGSRYRRYEDNSRLILVAYESIGISFVRIDHGTESTNARDDLNKGSWIVYETTPVIGTRYPILWVRLCVISFLGARTSLVWLIAFVFTYCGWWCGVMQVTSFEMVTRMSAIVVDCNSDHFLGPRKKVNSIHHGLLRALSKRRRMICKLSDHHWAGA